MHELFGAAVTSVDVNRRRKRRAGHDGGIAGRDHFGGSASRAFGRGELWWRAAWPGATEVQPGNREQQNRTASSRGQIRADDSSPAGGGLRTHVKPGISDSG
jgi:hypothetical protein